MRFRSISSAPNTRQADKWFDSDLAFHRLYPVDIQMLARRHWTPLHIARLASQFLAQHSRARILDIGSGAGKFCLASAYYKPQAQFTGVEQRIHLVDIAESAKGILDLNNLEFVHANFTQIDFRSFNAFYFYNSFYENLITEDRIDESIDYSSELYHYYCRFLFQKLEEMQPGTRLVTYHSLEDEIPPSYELKETHAEGLLKCWEKK